MKAAAGAGPVLQLLRDHPKIHSLIEDPTINGCLFGDALTRRVDVGNPDVVDYGLLELIDNNPLVCADAMSVPSLGPSLASICLGPLLLAGTVQEAPALVFSFPTPQREVDLALERLNWEQGATLRIEEAPITELALATGMAIVETPDDPQDILDLYEERFGRSFLIRSAGASDWNLNLVSGQAFACYRVSISLDGTYSLVTVRAMVDGSGLFQGAQVVRSMNVMCGFEDILSLTA